MKINIPNNIKQILYSTLIIVFTTKISIAQGLFKSLANKVAKSKEPVREYAYLSDFHKKNVGKIIFYKKPGLSWSELNEQTLSSKFELSDTISALAFDDVPIIEYINKSYPNEKENKIFNRAGLTYHWYIDGNLVSKDFVETGGLEGREKNYYELGFVYNFGRWEEEPIVWRKFIRTNLAALTPGSHQIKLQLLIGVEDSDTLLIKEPIASGTFELSINSNKIDPTNTTVCFPKPYKNKRDIKLEEELMKAFKKAQLGEPYKVVLQDAFVENRNAIGSIESRRSWAIIAFKKDGKCLSTSYAFKQYYGSSEYADIEFTKQLDKEVLDCGCFK